MSSCAYRTPRRLRPIVQSARCVVHRLAWATSSGDRPDRTLGRDVTDLLDTAARAATPGIAVEAVELVRIRMPLVAPFRTSFGVELHRDVLLVHVIANESEGWGECVAMEEPLYSSEYTAAA